MSALGRAQPCFILKNVALAAVCSLQQPCSRGASQSPAGWGCHVGDGLFGPCRIPKARWHGRCPQQGEEDVTSLSFSCLQAGGGRQEKVWPVLAPGEGFPGVLRGPDHHQPGRGEPQPLQENHPGDPQLRGAWLQLPGMGQHGGTSGPLWPGVEEGRGSNPPAFPQTREQRLVSHFQYLSWPDYGVPSSAATLIDFLGAVKQQQRVAVSALGPRFKGHPGGPPVVVHCSAGIGRTGTGVSLLLGRGGLVVAGDKSSLPPGHFHPLDPWCVFKPADRGCMSPGLSAAIRPGRRLCPASPNARALMWEVWGGGVLRTTATPFWFLGGTAMALWWLMPSPLLSPGTFCALDICLSQLQDVGTLNIYQTVLRMRTQRAFSIQTPEQYYFCYTAVLEHAHREGLLLANHSRAGQEKSSPGH